MRDNIKDHVLNDECFGDCKECGERTSKDKLCEFGGICEDCYYRDK